MFQLVITYGSQYHTSLRKSFDSLVPCFSGMLVSDTALHRNQDPFIVERVTFCTDDQVLFVELKDHQTASEEKAKETEKIFRLHGWE
jgi:hypothetical protein